VVDVTPRQAIFRVLDRACCLTHPIVHHRPFLWLPLPVCPLATLGFHILGDDPDVKRDVGDREHDQ
jgi:hypothetical protein